MKKTVFFILFANILFPPCVFSEERLTLEQAIDIALTQNPEIIAAQKGLIVSQGKRLQMQALADPSLVFSNEGMNFRKKADSQGETEVSLGVEQFLEFPGRDLSGERLGGLAKNRPLWSLIESGCWSEPG